jgi:hypothetical protein
MHDAHDVLPFEPAPSGSFFALTSQYPYTRFGRLETQLECQQFRASIPSAQQSQERQALWANAKARPFVVQNFEQTLFKFLNKNS